MKNKTLGDVVRDRRESMRFTQRELADQVGVKASHVAYIENGQRRPSLPLLRRIAETLGLDSQELLFLSHPDAKHLLRTETTAPKKKEDVWRQFSSNRALLRRNAVTAQELKVLRQVNLLQPIAAPRHFLFILNSIRQAAAED